MQFARVALNASLDANLQRCGIIPKQRVIKPIGTFALALKKWENPMWSHEQNEWLQKSRSEEWMPALHKCDEIAQYCLGLSLLWMSRTETYQAQSPVANLCRGVFQDLHARHPGAPEIMEALSQLERGRKEAAVQKLIPIHESFKNLMSEGRTREGKAAIQELIAQASSDPNYDPLRLAVHHTELADCLLRQPSVDWQLFDMALAHTRAYVSGHPYESYEFSCFFAIEAYGLFMRGSLGAAKISLAMATHYLQKFPDAPEVYHQRVNAIKQEIERVL